MLYWTLAEASNEVIRRQNITGKEHHIRASLYLGSMVYEVVISTANDPVIRTA
jgi:hypothetical protein